MKPAIVVGGKDLKRILAVYFGVEEKDVVPTKYSYTIIGAKLHTDISEEDPEMN